MKEAKSSPTTPRQELRGPRRRRDVWRCTDGRSPDDVITERSHLARQFLRFVAVRAKAPFFFPLPNESGTAAAGGGGGFRDGGSDPNLHLPN